MRVKNSFQCQIIAFANKHIKIQSCVEIENKPNVTLNSYIFYRHQKYYIFYSSRKVLLFITKNQNL